MAKPMSMKAARVNAKLTQVEAAKKIGVTQNTIYRWEKGEIAPSFRHMHKICNAYNLDSCDDIIFLPEDNALSVD